MTQGDMSEKAVNGLCSQSKVLTLDTMNPNVKRVEYAVRGPLVQRAVQIEKELKEVNGHKVLCWTRAGATLSRNFGQLVTRAVPSFAAIPLQSQGCLHHKIKWESSRARERG